MPETLAAADSTIAAAPARTHRGAAIAGLAMAIPPGVVDNAPIAERLGVSERWIVERTGVERRRIAAPEVRIPDLGAEAATAALAEAGIEAAELDMVLVATMSHDKLTPNAAPLVAAEIGADRAGCVDVGAACTGFLSAVALGTGLIESDRVRHVLVVGADMLTRFTNHDDKSTAALFGDGAGAVVLTDAAPPGRIGPVVLGADGGDGAELIQCGRAEGLIRMKGPDTFRNAVDRLCEATVAATASAGCALDDVDLFAYHQANSRIIRAVGERLELDDARVVDCVPYYGNTSAASIPIALSVAREQGLLHDGATVLCAAFGGGLTWGACVLKWGRDG
jgi:3-oxoacyl-[acyl-carrier-protein] synthase-3